MPIALRISLRGSLVVTFFCLLSVSELLPVLLFCGESPKPNLCLDSGIKDLGQ